MTDPEVLGLVQSLPAAAPPLKLPGHATERPERQEERQKTETFEQRAP